MEKNHFESILNEFGFRRISFYNPKVSRLSLDISLTGPTIQLVIARTLNPQHTGKIEKGTQVYDNDNQLFFSLSPSECNYLLNTIPLLLKGQFNNPKAKDEKYSKCISVEHFKDNKVSRLVLDKPKEGTNAALSIVIFPPYSEDSKPCAYHLRKDEFNIFINYIRRGLEDLPYHFSLVSAVVKLLKQLNYSVNNKSGEGNSNNSGSYNNYSATSKKSNDYSDYSNSKPDNDFSDISIADSSDDDFSINF